MGTVYRPPGRFKQPYQPLVFLAGPIQGAPDWQERAIQLIEALAPDLDIASPRWDGDQVTLTEVGKQAQFDWESDYLAHAAAHGAILFWGACQACDVPGRSYAQTTRAEFGRYVALHEIKGAQLAVGAEAGFHGRGFWRRTLGRYAPQVKLRGTLEATCHDAILRARIVRSS